MWPWEHLAFGYLLAAVLLRTTQNRPPTDAEAVFVALASQLPDLVDKPLAWRFDVVQAGLSFGHSILFVGPVLTVVVVLTYRADRPFTGVAVTVAYLTHLVGDAVYPLVFGRPVRTDFLLWPLRDVPPSYQSLGLFEHVSIYFDRTTALLSTQAGEWFLALEIVLLGGAIIVFLFDGAPGMRVPWRWTVAALGSDEKRPDS